MSKQEFVYRKEGLKLTEPDEIVVEQREDIKELKKQISDLEAKLAEKEKEIEELKFQINVKDGENAELEKRIYELDGNGFCSGECWCCDYFKDGNDGYSVCTYKADQDKISFAVERLRKAKFDALMLGGLVQGETFFINSEHYRNYIDNQIASLKKGVE